ncbi:MAG: hypothetical protein OEU76_07745, partial [Cyclobacteriaceae bacterium]|nr:hypothetical protein [Cyclobacteriaceae bacterium]
MNKIRVISVVAALLSFVARSQSSTERQALNNLEKGKWERARGRLVKTLRKDSTDVTAQYVMSSYFFAEGNPSYQIDSAYRYVMKAISGYSVAEPKAIDKMRRFPLDSAILVQRRMAIDSAAFVRAKQLHTERSYLEFIERFPFAKEQNRAKELRDEVAYVDALKENTYESFNLFLTKYPNASRAKEARERYEFLLFEAKTKDSKLVSFKSFIEEFPGSPYRPNAELQVFEISTASGKSTTFSDFINLYPNSNLVSKARNILYHILKEEERAIPIFILTDSLRNL